jgi:regulator of protease activity HflC (stomatin/prohibitin superfamily)
MFTTGFLVLVLLVVCAIVLFKAVRMVPQGYEWTVERFGKYTHTLTPGLHILIPIVYGVGRKVNMMEQVLDVPRQDVITKDNAVVAVDGVVFFQVLDAAKAAYEVANLELATIALVQTNIRTVIGSMDLDESLSQRETINAQLLSVVDHATNPWGIKVTRIEIRDIQPPRDLVDAMARQMKAEREKRAQILEAEGSRQSEILRADGEKQAAVLEAEGRKEAAFRDAEARERLAEAEAKATQMVSDAIASGNVQAINYFIAQKYVEAFKELATAPNQKFVLMPMESAGIIGSIAGIADLAREALPTAPRRRRRARRSRRASGAEPCAPKWSCGRRWPCCCSRPRRWRPARSCCGWASPPPRCSWRCGSCRASRCWSRRWPSSCCASSRCRSTAPGSAAASGRATSRCSTGVPSNWSAGWCAWSRPSSAAAGGSRSTTPSGWSPGRTCRSAPRCAWSPSTA